MAADAAPRQVTIASDPVRARQQFLHFYLAKAANPDYAARKASRGLPEHHHDFPEEAWIKAARAEVARHVQAPAGADVLPIPVVTGPPRVDGRIGEEEWSAGTLIEPRAGTGGSRLWLLSDGSYLYLACDVPADTTPGGFDQFRFYYHLDLMPELVNERIHVRGGQGADTAGHANAIRQTGIRVNEEPASPEENWQAMPISDWYVLDSAEGAAGMHPHRQYEARFLLEEAGMHPGVPFAARAEVETDETRDGEGKFVKRNYAGEYGSQQQPIWLRIDPG